MWNGLVSIPSAFASGVVYRFLEVYWHHPIVGTVFMTAFLILAALFWIETAKDTLRRRDRPGSDRSIQVRR